MIAVDTSALVAIVNGEPEGRSCLEVLSTETRVIMSAGSLAEALIVAGRKGISREMSRLIGEFAFETIPVTETFAVKAAAAYAYWGRGNHAARLNFGDCFAYVLAKEHHCSLLYIGSDFSQTDIISAIVPKTPTAP